MQRSHFLMVLPMLMFLSFARPLYSQTPDSFNPSPNDVVFSMAIQPDGKLLLGGNFSNVGGQPHNNFGRVNTDGSLDAAFAVDATFIVDAGNAVSALALLPDGSIILGGSFGFVNDATQVRLGRVTADGVLQPFPWANDGPVECLALQADGKLLAGGGFDLLGGQLRYRIGRINTDGSVDSVFNPSPDNAVNSMVVQPDGKILVAGYFGTLAGTNRAHLGRLNSDGSIDAAFNPGADNFVNCLALQADGKIVVGGAFTNLAGQARSHIGRLNSDGSIDAGFNPGANDQVYSLAIQADGAILAGGYFTNLGGLSRNYIGRIATNGVVDATFNPNAGGRVSSLAIQADGKVLVGGWFNTLGNSNRTSLGRLSNTAPATQSLSYASQKITWLRGGTSPEIWRSTFDYSTNGGSNWTALAAPSRIVGGWQLTNVSISGTASIRARGFVSGGQYGGSSWFVETNIGPLAITQQPLSRTNLPGANASFTVRVGGGSPPAYQWRKNGTNLVNTANITGVTNATLAISAAFGLDSGAYTVVINDGHTTLTSLVATLTVPDPIITLQPISRTNNALTTATFTVDAIGQAPLNYSWIKNGTALNDTGNISGSHTSTLTLSNVLGGDAGAYSTIVTDASGSSTSLVANLVVVDPIITSQPVSLNGSPGGSATFSVGVIGSPLSYQWRLNGSPLIGSNAPSLSFSGLTAANAGFYDVIVSNTFGVLTSAVAVLTVNYATADSLNPGVFSPVSALAVQPDGKIILGQQFNLDRLNQDGTYDGSWFSSVNPAVFAFAIQTNIATVFGGSFTVVDSQNQAYLAHLNPGGSFDFGFNLAPNGIVRCLAVQADGRILVGGDFTTIGGQPRNRLCRVMPDGSLDPAFNPGADGSVSAFALQPDGQIIVGGSFQNLAGQAHQGIARLDANGSPDPGFNPGQNGSVAAIAVQPDGKIIVGGMFSALGGSARGNLGRLNSGGSLDLGFNPPTDNAVTGLALETDGRIVVGGAFQTLAGVPLGSLGRLNPNGSPDLTFNPAANGVTALAIQKNGSIVVAGAFTTLAGQPRNGIARLNNVYPTSALESVSFDTSSVTWLRSGPSTELWRATFESSTDGANWTPLGAASHISGGWQLSGLAIPTNSIVRARGFVVGGNWFVETIVGLPVFASQPQSLTNYATSNVTFTATAYGGTPFSYQWFKNGVPYASGQSVSAQQSISLTLTNLLGTDAAGYSMVLSNSSGSVTSSVANLTVIDPWAFTQPVSASKIAGQSAAMTFGVFGTTPFSFQWLQNGTNLIDSAYASTSQVGKQTLSTLILTNLTGANAGAYQAIVTNVWGSVTSSIATLTVADPSITANPTNQFLQRGQTVFLSVTAVGSLPMSYQWFDNGSPVPGATNALLSFTNAQGSNAGKYYAVVGNTFGNLTSSVATITVNMAVPDSFNPGASFELRSIAVQPDGKILVSASAFPDGLQRTGTPVRFNPDGSFDSSFNSVVSSSQINALGVQADGKILVAGESGQGAISVWRLNADGSSDTAFTNNLKPLPFGNSGSLALQPDAKIIVAGGFTIGKPAIWTNLVRINASGTIDSNFLVGANSSINSVALQPDGSMVVGGGFAVLNGQAHSRIGRINADASVDTNFNASANSTVNCLLVQPDGKILVAGPFTSLNGQTINRLGRLNPDGTLDTAFNPNINNTVLSLALQTDGKIIAGGSFTSIGGIVRSFLGRINPDGTLDLTFNPGPSSTVLSLAMQSDGAILCGGSFSTVNGLYRTNIARLLPTEPATQTLASDGSTITWLRGGTSPEVWRTTFESSTNGIDWTSLGAGQRRAGGWQLTGLNLLSTRNIRVRGFLTGSQNDGSASIVENILGAPTLASQPLSRTNSATTTAAFSVTSGGGAPLSYQWLKGGAPIANGGNVSGANTPLLTLSNVFGADAGGYSVIITNPSGAITSSVATLTVIEPIITRQPTNQFAFTGQNASFTVTAIGTAPLTYQWRKNGTNFSGPNAATLTLTNVTRSVDAAIYSVFISSAFGSVTSSVVTLLVDPAVPDAFNPGAGASVNALAIQADGKILLGGDFTNLAGLTRNYLGRLNTNGTLDTNFNAVANNSVECFAIQPDGRILVGGWFGGLGGQPRNFIGRLNQDGSLDNAFNPGADSPVSAMAVQPDGKILVGGYFNNLAGRSSPHIGRLNPDGTADTNFVGTANNNVFSVALQGDGKIVLGGAFTGINSDTHTFIARLNADGTVDPDFHFPAGANDVVYSTALQPDGRIVVAGNFTSIGGGSRAYFGRLNSDGSLDVNFNPPITGSQFALAIQADGKIIVGGPVSPLMQQAGSGLTFMGRFNPDGSIDTTFSPTPNSATLAFAIQADGEVLVGGSFTSVSGQARNRIARLTATDAATQYLSSDGQTITWLRGGTAPEFSRATFETSTDATNWTSAGLGQPIFGGWRLNGITVPAKSWVRARGYATGGYYNGSGWFVESLAQVLAPPTIFASGVYSNQFTFSIGAVPGQVVVIEASTDFLNWIPIQTNLLTALDAAGLVFADSQGGLFPRRFYRARLYQGALPAPALGGSPGFQSGRFGFNLAGVAGQTIVIEAATNITGATWTPLVTNFLSTVPLHFSDPASTNFPRRFYRARVP